MKKHSCCKIINEILSYIALWFFAVMLVNHFYKSSKLNAFKLLTTVLAVLACTVKVVAFIEGAKHI